MKDPPTSGAVSTSPGDAVRRRREELALTQAQAADLAKVSLTTWSKLERNEGPFSARVRRMACEALGLPLDVFTLTADVPAADVQGEAQILLATAAAEMREMAQKLEASAMAVEALRLRLGPDLRSGQAE